MDNEKGGKCLLTDEDKTALRRKRILAIVTAVVSIVLIAGIVFYIMKALQISFNTDGGVENAAENFKSIIEGYGSSGVIVAFFIHVLQVIISPLPGEIVEIGMGLCFGWLGGTIICLLGNALGAYLILLFVKKLGVKFVELFVSVDKINQLKILKDGKNLERLIFLIYLIPGTPKDMLIFFFGLTNISIPRFLVIQTIARIPSIISSTIGGNFLVEGKFLSAILLFAVTGAVSLIGILIYNKTIERLNKRKQLKQEVQTSIENKE